MIPPFVNDFIYMLKDSAIISVISGTELTSIMLRATFLNSSNTLPLYAMGLILYLAMSLPISFIARFFERRLRAVSLAIVRRSQLWSRTALDHNLSQNHAAGW